MWPCSKSKKFGESGLFKGLTDWHSHILPGVDDGIRTEQESLALLDEYERAGIKEVWFTPHIMEDVPNTTSGLKERFDEFTSRYKGNIRLHIAAENMLDTLFEERLKDNDLLTIGNSGQHLLVETSYVSPPYAMDEMIDATMKKGYTPILAHPERYRYMDEKDYREWKERGLLFQINYMSLAGGYGETARKKAEWLLKQGMVDMTGSDVHRQIVFERSLDLAPKKADALRTLIELSRTDPTL